MRVGLIAGALVALAVTEPALGQAEVPCTNIGGGKYECSWYRPGNGFSGGSIVAVGTTTVGYLPQGRNWILCEEKGGDMRSPEGYKNHWFGWTQAENGQWGWASALDASGGDDYGSFGGGTPSCKGAHGTPPAYNGLWGSPPVSQPAPPPAAPGVDADGDGVPAPLTATTPTRGCTRARRTSRATGSTATAWAATSPRGWPRPSRSRPATAAGRPSSRACA